MGQMPLPIKLWGRLPKKGHINMESVHPILKSRGLSKRLGSMTAAHMGLLNNYLDFPLESHNSNSLLAAETSFLGECHFSMMWRAAMRTTAQVNIVPVSTHSHLCRWSQKTRGPFSKDAPSTHILSPSHSLHLFQVTTLDHLHTSFLSSFSEIRPVTLMFPMVFSLHLFYILICQEDFVEFYIL